MSFGWQGTRSTGSHICIRSFITFLPQMKFQRAYRPVDRTSSCRLSRHQDDHEVTWEESPHTHARPHNVGNPRTNRYAICLSDARRTVRSTAGRTPTSRRCCQTPPLDLARRHDRPSGPRAERAVSSRGWLSAEKAACSHRGIPQEARRLWTHDSL
ncbi:hypothetical protein BJV74DRAFT_817307 [Russula compacta]|nr:hypothetical protein BJV74DRAFT_817307 [Russula compacta]